MLYNYVIFPLWKLSLIFVCCLPKTSSKGSSRLFVRIAHLSKQGWRSRPGQALTAALEGLAQMQSYAWTLPRAKDATSNIRNCHEFVFCHKWSMGLCFNFPHCPLSGNNHKYCPESLSHNLKCDPAQFPIRQPSGRWKKSIFVLEWSRL